MRHRGGARRDAVRVRLHQPRRVWLRQVRRDRGELLGPDVQFETKHGPAAFVPGDRVQFTDTLKAARIYNGNVGTTHGPG